jgi:GPH family glycoside/pentoside/hexuronide:cation symporter
MAIQGRLGFTLKTNYGMAQMGESLVNGALGAFLLFYYSQVLGVPPSMAAMGVGTAVIVDAFTDPMVGSISDNWRSRLGRRHPFLIVGAIPTGICLFMLFNPLVSGNVPLLIWMIVFVNLTRTFMTIFHIPHIALGAELSEDYDERSSIVGFRTFFGNIGGLLAFVLGFWLFFKPTPEFVNGQLNAAAYPPFAGLIGTMVIVATLWTALSTRHVISSLPQPEAAARINLFEGIKRMAVDSLAALACRNFFWLFLGVLILFIIIGVGSALGVYMFTFFWELPRQGILILAPAFPIGALMGISISPYLLRVTSKKAMLQFGLVAWAWFQMLPVVLRLLGWFPENGSELLVPLLFSIGVIQGICTVQSNIAFGSMNADCVDEHELTSGRRQEGIFFAASSFATKAPVGIGNIIAGFALQLIDWPVGEEIKTAADIAPAKIFELGLFVGPGIAASALICMWCYSRYTLTREGHQEILITLAARREPAESPSTA